MRSALSFSRSRVRRGGAFSPAKNSSGCGSNVTSVVGTARSRPSAASCPISARWPRCTPSKLPMVATQPWCSGRMLCQPRMTSNSALLVVVRLDAAGTAPAEIPQRPSPRTSFSGTIHRRRDPASRRLRASTPHPKRRRSTGHDQFFVILHETSRLRCRVRGFRCNPPILTRCARRGLPDGAAGSPGPA